MQTRTNGVARKKLMHGKLSHRLEEKGKKKEKRFLRVSVDAQSASRARSPSQTNPDLCQPDERFQDGGLRSIYTRVRSNVQLDHDCPWRRCRVSRVLSVTHRHRGDWPSGWIDSKCNTRTHVQLQVPFLFEPLVFDKGLVQVQVRQPGFVTT